MISSITIKSSPLSTLLFYFKLAANLPQCPILINCFASLDAWIKHESNYNFSNSNIYH